MFTVVHNESHLFYTNSFFDPLCIILSHSSFVYRYQKMYSVRKRIERRVKWYITWDEEKKRNLSGYVKEEKMISRLSSFLIILSTLWALHWEKHSYIKNGQVTQQLYLHSFYENPWYNEVNALLTSLSSALFSNPLSTSNSFSPFSSSSIEPMIKHNHLQIQSMDYNFSIQMSLAAFPILPLLFHLKSLYSSIRDLR